ncbi:MAG: AAA domain-containing protein [Planctomycetota bacterium]
MAEPTDPPKDPPRASGIDAFSRFLDRARDLGGLHDEDIVALMIPVLELARSVHEEGRVLDLRGLAALRIADGRLALDVSSTQAPVRTPAVGLVASTTPVGRLADDNERSRAITERLVPGYAAWEQLLGHHDAASDIHVLGLVMASLACGMSLADQSSIDRFAAHRERLHELAPRTNPVLLRTIRSCASARRAERPADLAEVILRLRERHRIDPDCGIDLSNAPGFRNHDTTTRENWILSRLRRRLFDLSRRNRLLYFRRSASQLDLAVASVPLAVEAAHVPVERVLVWDNTLGEALAKHKSLDLQDRLDLVREPDLVARLDRIRGDARKAKFEFGVDALRLVVAFLHWTDSRISPPEVVVSPLVLLPVALVRPRGGRGRYELRCESLEAEINGVLAHSLHDAFGIELPAVIDLEQTTVETLVDGLTKQLANCRPDVVLEHRTRPDIAVLLSERSGIQDSSPPLPPDRWIVDTTRPTLGSFASRRMSFVRDYDHMLGQDDKGEGFSRWFTTEPRSPLVESAAESSVPHEPLVVPADPTQRRAVRAALAGQSYVIQGPPGTGKSQTITNLIATLAAEHKRVLFVCQKRAALDVVAHRLRERGLAEVTCRIHDAVSDKRAFIDELRRRYEELSTANAGASDPRAELRERIESLLQPIAQFEIRMESTTGVEPATPRELLETLATQSGPCATPNELEIPSFADWVAHRDAVREIARVLSAMGRPPHWASHPLARAPQTLWADSDPRSTAAVALDGSEKAWQGMAELLAGLGMELETFARLSDIQSLLAAADRMSTVAQRDRLDVFDRTSSAARELAALLGEIAANDQRIDALGRKTAPWRSKLSADEARRARDHWQATHRRWLRIFDGRWRQIRKLVRRQFDMSGFQVAPTVSEILDDLCAEHTALEQRSVHLHSLVERFGFDSSMTARELLGRMQGQAVSPPWSLLLGKSATAVLALAAALPSLSAQMLRLATLHEDPEALTPAELSAWLSSVRDALPGLRTLAPRVAELGQAPRVLLEFVRSTSSDPGGLEHAVARAALSSVRAVDHNFDTLDDSLRTDRVSRAAELQRTLLDHNAEHVRQRTFAAFLAASHDNATEPKRWREGCRILEHEFGKTMRFRSARDLLASPARDVLLAMKPIWLMSPQSVADVLPLEAATFDVVIFDEASQITLEEGLPTALRARHAIVVGDEMQMPPTDFFSTAADVGQEDAEDAAAAAIRELDVDSLLDQAARKLPAVMLGWHYRSRHEALISYGNAAFYGRGLLTIPSPDSRSVVRQPIAVRSTDDARSNAEAIFDRPISFHRCEHAVYSARRNPAEAEYVARLVKELLGRGLSLGVVAFSIEQQSAIEDALDALASADTEFARSLDEEYVREEDGQFVGLFVKNLENVQGDERDVIIMSVCYGPDRDGKVRMNFGPINQRGGERRLNVIMSRSRVHMAVVSSISGSAITNLHNAGAAHLAGFLDYAERMSIGDTESASRILDSLSRVSTTTRASRTSPTVLAIARALSDVGCVIEHDVGDSAFRVDLAVRLPDLPDRALGLLIDHQSTGAPTELFDRVSSRPALLRRVGWRVLTVSLREWHDDAGGCVARMLNALRD